MESRQPSVPDRARKASKKGGKLEQTPIQTVRIVMFGLGGVGKTSLIHRFLFGKYDSAYTATIEDDYRQVITYNNHIVDVTVLDTAGSYQFPAMRKHAIQNGQGFLLVYAIDNKQSLDEVSRIYLEIINVKGTENKLPIIVVGNKSDKAEVGKRKVDFNNVNDLISSWGRGVDHVETSAKMDTNVTLLFNKMIWIIDEVRVKKEGKTSINFKTTYDQAVIPEEKPNGPNRTYSVDHSCSAGESSMHSLSPHVAADTHGRYSVYERNSDRTEVEYNRSRSLYNWEKSAQDNESEKIKKKQSSLRNIFSRKSIM